VGRDEMKTIGLKIKSFRKIMGISQMELAGIVGISYQQIQKYEKGISRISVDRLKQIADALGVPITEFFASEDYKVSETPAAYSTMTDDELQLLLHYRKIKKRKLKKAILALLSVLAGSKISCENTGL
jgi:transcriptional regulator with XRE-family HTH domain